MEMEEEFYDDSIESETFSDEDEDDSPVREAAFRKGYDEADEFDKPIKEFDKEDEEPTEERIRKIGDEEEDLDDF